jgi:hypothetical protein
VLKVKESNVEANLNAAAEVNLSVAEVDALRDTASK